MIEAISSTRNRIAGTPLASRLVGAAVWSIAGTALSSAISLLTMIAVARLLGKEVYGQFVILQSTLGMAGVLAGFGMGSAATRYVAELKLKDKVRLSRILAVTERALVIFGGITTFVLMEISAYLAPSLLHSSTLHMPLLIAALSIVFSALDGYQKSILVGLESTRALAMGTVIGAILGAPMMIAAAAWYGLVGMAVAMVINAAIQACISRFQLNGELKSFSISRLVPDYSREWPVLRDFALPALVAGALVLPTHWICQAILANTPNGYAEIAVLGVAMQWFNIILFLPSVAGRVVLPILTEQVCEKNQAGVKRVLQYSIASNAAVTLPAAMLVVLLSPWIISLYGVGFTNGSLCISIAVLAACVLSVQTPVGNMVAAVSRMWMGASMNCAWAVVYVVLSILLLGYGSIGVIGAMAIAYSVHAIWTFAFAYSHIR